MKVDVVLPVTKVLGILGRPIVYYPMIGRALGSMDAAIFLGNFMYWDGKQADKEEGFIFKNAIDIAKETGLKRSRQKNAREILRQFGILSEKKEDFPPKVYYRFNWDQLDKILSDFITNEKPDINLKEILNSQEEAKEVPKKEKAPKVKKDIAPSILFQMKEIFDEVYESHEQFEMGYQWSKDKKGGKDWRPLKMLRDALYDRAIVKKRKQFEKNKEPVPEKIEISNEEILGAWKLFLQALSPYRIKRSFTPAKLYADFNPILQEILDDNKIKNTSTNATTKQRPRSEASDYAGELRD